jgi:leader peptidase (prepilin peptidase)/N-methyltransferase
VRRREGMGLGDVKLFAMFAAWLGPENALLILFLAVVTGAIYGIVSLMRQRRPATQRVNQTRTPHRVPLGSFLCAAAIYAVFAGHQTIAWYLRFFR